MGHEQPRKGPANDPLDGIIEDYEDEPTVAESRVGPPINSGDLIPFIEEADDVPQAPQQAATLDVEMLVPENDQRLTVELMADGRLRAPSPTAREMLRDRMRRTEMLRTGPEWVVLRTLVESSQPASPSKSQPEQPSGREVIAAGTLGSGAISLIDFIGFLANGVQTGVLTAASGDVERSVYFYRGDVVWAASSSGGDRLGEFLLQRGRITREQLGIAVRDVKPIGRACVERGFLAAHELFAMVQAQLTDIFDKMLATERGLWFFSRMSEAQLAESQIHLSTQGLLVDALRRLDEMQIYRQRVRTADVLVQRVRSKSDGQTNTDDLVAQLDDNLRANASQLLRQLPGSATIAELMRILGKGEFEVTRTVYHLLRRGLVEIVQTAEEGAIPKRVASISKTEAHEVISIYSMAIREMFNEVGRIGRSAELQSSANAFLRDESTAYARFLRAASLGPDGTIDESAMLLALATVPISSQELSDALSELLFFVLFQATEFLGRRRGDDLARRVKLILGMLAHTSAGRGQAG